MSSVGRTLITDKVKDAGSGSLSVALAGEPGIDRTVIVFNDARTVAVTHPLSYGFRIVDIPTRVVNGHIEVITARRSRCGQSVIRVRA